MAKIVRIFGYYKLLYIDLRVGGQYTTIYNTQIRPVKIENAPV